MIPYEEAKWEHIAGLSGGDLQRISYPILLAALGRSGRSVTIEMSRKPIDKQVVIEEGSPVDCRSNLVHETFGRFLVSVGKLSNEEFNTTLAESLAQEVPLGEILMAKEIIDAVELYKLLQQSLARKLLDGFTWREGSFQLTEARPEVDTGLKVRMPQLILTGVLKLSPMEEVSEGIKPFLTEPLAYNPSPPFDEDELQFRGSAARVVEALERKPLRMDELVSATACDPDDLGRIIYALAILDVVIPASRLATAGARQFTKRVLQTRPIEAPTFVPPPLQEQQLERVRRKVLETYLSYRRKDAFDLLEVDEEADRARVERHFLRYSQTFAPWILEAQAPGELADKAKALFLAGAEAYAELIDNERRTALEQRRKVLRDAKRRKQATQEKIATDLLDPEVQFDKGMELLQQGEKRKALDYLEFAADCDPQNGVYRAEAAYCRYVVLNARDKAIEELQGAIRADSRCGLAYYYLGLVLAAEHDLSGAEENLRRAIKLMAPDRRPIEALRDLSGRKGKGRRA